MKQPFKIFNEDDGTSPYVLVSDHAGQAIPSHLGDLGLDKTERGRHIGWDIGIDGVGHCLVKRLHCVLIEQLYSRLVIDCNRMPFHPTSIVQVSDGTDVPGNQNLTPQEIAWRHKNILHAYQDYIGSLIDKRLDEGREVFLISLHSFTPHLRTDHSGEVKRPWDVGILHNREHKMANIMISLLSKEGLCVGDNQPYALTDRSDYTIPLQAEKRELPYLEIEIRQDHLANPTMQHKWGVFLSEILPRAWEEYKHQS